MQLKVLSWNIWIHGHFDHLTDFLRQSNADIIGLQEVQADDPEREVITYLTGLGYQHVFAPVTKTFGGQVWNDGPALFSKYPIKKSHTYLLSETDARAAVRADIDIDDKTLHVFSTHLIHPHHKEPSAVQEAQGQNLTKLLPGERTIVMGDFNATPESAVIRQMQTVLVDTDPSSLPTWRLP